MKGLFMLFFLFFLAKGASAQSNLPTTDFYAQALVYLASDNDYQQLSADLASNPYVRVVRVDQRSHQLFVATKDVSAFDESILTSWLGNYISGVSCIHTGIIGITPVKTYINGECPSDN